MSFLIFYPAVAMLALFIMIVVIVMLRFGPRLCNLRHTAFNDDYKVYGEGYEQKVSYAESI